jgi:hypothetical protein
MRSHVAAHVRSHATGWLLSLVILAAAATIVFLVGGWPKVAELVADRTVELVAVLVGSGVCLFVYAQALLYYELEARMPLDDLAVAEALRPLTTHFEDVVRNYAMFGRQHLGNEPALADRARELERARQEWVRGLRARLDELGVPDPGIDPVAGDDGFNADRIAQTVNRDFNAAVCRALAVSHRVSAAVDRLWAQGLSKRQARRSAQPPVNSSSLAPPSSRA